MKKIFLIFYAFVFFTNIIFASDESVYLVPNEVKKLSAPEIDKAVFSALNQKGEFVSKDYDSEYFEADDEVFETKSGQIFGKFIDDKVINNKFINYSNRLKNN